ncbi:hypothetical protein XELAEV_18043583mg, partial [Xenopus laevis]
ETLSRSQGDRAGENQRRAEVGLAGEQLRLWLHNAKDRCQDTRTYPNCLVGKELVDWLDKITSQEESILQVREQGSERYRRTFLGQQILDWLLDHGEVSSREEGVKLCRELLEHGIIQHVSGHQHFSDSEMLFQFTINFRRRRKLIEVLNDPDPVMDPKQESPDSPFCLRKLGSDLPHNNFVCVQHNEPKIVPAPRRCGYSSPGSGSSYTYLSPSVPLKTPPSVLKRPVTAEELLSPGAPYVRKILIFWGMMSVGGL